MDTQNKNIRNVAVIAHVDHGKTTLVDALLKQTNVFRENEEEMDMERILDSNDLEREKGITILAKICSVFYKDTKINIIDTPGHADFSGEVERTLGMADGAILIVDAQEGPMPQTRFVLRKALELNLKIIVVINKIDKKYARVAEVVSKVENLFLELASHDKHLDFPVLYAIGRKGAVFSQYPENLSQESNVNPLLDTIVDYINAPVAETEKPFKMLISNIEYDSHTGRIAIGRIYQGKLVKGQKVIVQPGKSVKTIEKIMVSQGLGKIEVDEANAGELVSIYGIFDASIGATISDPSDTIPLPSPQIGEPTLHMSIGPNTSPLSGKEGEFTTARQIQKRLEEELEHNLSLKLKVLGSGKFLVSGRGELHLAILLETLRREGYELEVGKPEVITKEIEGEIHEPEEEVNILVPNEFVGVINQELGKRYAQLVRTEPVGEGETEFIYKIPTRSIIGLRNILLTKTKGSAIFSSQMIGYQKLGKSLPKLRKGALISATTGDALAYGLANAQGRGITFIAPGTRVYEGMIIGINAKDEDISINVCKGKKLTNMRAASADATIHITPPTILSLEQCLGFIESDELLEITPQSLRLRKRYLSELDRKRNNRNQ